jgi:hypothetical protein
VRILGGKGESVPEDRPVTAPLTERRRGVGRPAMAVILAVVVVVVVAGAVTGGYVLGHRGATTGHTAAAARQQGYQAGHDAGYFDGVQAGEAQGVQEGRALQASGSVAADARQAVASSFTAGYAAGANDAFGNFDGGWAVATPYLVEVLPGTGGVQYRISRRTLLAPGTNYYLYPDGRTICSGSRR